MDGFEIGVVALIVAGLGAIGTYTGLDSLAPPQEGDARSHYAREPAGPLSYAGIRRSATHAL